MFINKHRNSLIIAIVLLTIGAGLWYYLHRDEGGTDITLTAEEYRSYDVYGFNYEQSEDEIYPMLEALLHQDHFVLTVSLEHHDIYVDMDSNDFNSVAKLLTEDQVIREIGYSEVKDEEDQGLNSYWIGYLDKSGNRVSITYYQNGIVNKTVGFIAEGEIVTVSNQLTKDVITMDLKKDNPLFFTETWQAMVDKEFVSYDEWAGSGLYFRQVGNQGYCTMMIYGSGVRIMTHFTTPVAINEDGTIRMTLPNNLSTGYLSEVEGDPEMVEVVLSLTGESIGFGALNYIYDSEAHTYDYILEMTESSAVPPELHAISENHSEKGYKLQAKSDMNYYALTMSSVPGLPIEVSLTTEEDRHLGVNCTVSEGDFITWDGSYTKQVGSDVMLDERNQTIYWTPLNENYDGIDQKRVYATVTMEVIDIDTNESLEVKIYTIYQSYGHFGFDEMPKLPNPDSSSQGGFAIYPVDLERTPDFKSAYEIGGTAFFTEDDLLNVDWEKQEFYFTSEFLDTLNGFKWGVLTGDVVSNDSLISGGSVILGSNNHRFVVVVDGVSIYEGFFQPSVVSSFAAIGVVLRDIEDIGIQINFLENVTGDPRFDERIREALMDKIE